MINTSLGTAARAGAAGGGGGSGGPCFTLLASLNCRLAAPAGFASDAADARNQEKAGNSERMAAPRQEPKAIAAAALVASPPRQLGDQELVNNKRGRDIIHGEMIWASKKQRSSVAAAHERDRNAIAEAKKIVPAATSSSIAQAKRAAAAAAAIAAASSPIAQEPKGHLPWGSIGVALDEKKEEKVRPWVFKAPVCGLDCLHRDWEVTAPNLALRSCRYVGSDRRHSAVEECLLIKRSRPCHSTMAVCDGGKRKMASAQLTEIQEPARRSNPAQEAKATGRHGRKTANYSGRCNTPPMRSFVSLNDGLQFLGVNEVTPILARTLTASDCCSGQSRLQFPTLEVMDSPLFSILTKAEHSAVHQLAGQKGLQLQAIDRHGYSYKVRLKYVYSAKRYRLMQAWVPFMRQNGVREGNLIEVGAFRVDGKPMLTLLNYATEGWIPEEIEAAEGLLMLSDCNNGTQS